MDDAERLISKAERIGWNEIKNGNKDIGWAMQEIASHILWWIYNSSDYSEEWKMIEDDSEPVIK